MELSSTERESVRLDRPRASWVCWLFVCAYGLFQLTHDAIIAARPSPLNAVNANPWLLRFIFEKDGLELYVATAGLFALLGLSVLPLPRKLAAFFGSPVVALGGVAAASLIVLLTRSTEFVKAVSVSTTVLVGLAASATLIAITKWSETEPQYRRVSIAVGALAAFVILFSGAGSSPEDYGYFLGPALKLFQGEPLNSLYMRYSLLGTGLFAAMMRMDSSMAQMEMWIAILTVVWFWFYWLLAGMVIRDSRTRVLFLAALFIVRFMALAYHPAVYPQSSPLRLDLWVPLALILWKYWSRPLVTGICFALGFLLDSTFGLFAFAAYMVLVTYQLFSAWQTGEVSGRKISFAAIPVLIAIGGRALLFGGVLPQAATQFDSVQLGFLPIPAHSLFWPVLVGMALAAVAAATQPDEKRKQFGAFLAVLSAMQMVYFFGRSHDHNLLCISGSWLLLFFFALDSQAFKSTNRRVILALSFCIFAAVVSAQRSRTKVGAVINHLRTFDPFPTQQIDRDIEPYRNAWPRGDSSVVLLAYDDSYWNYRLGLRQHGAYSPLFASMFRAETLHTLTDAIDKGRVIVLNRSFPDDWVAALNADSMLVRRNQAFAVEKIDGQLRRLRLVSTQVPVQPVK